MPATRIAVDRLLCDVALAVFFARPSLLVVLFCFALAGCDRCEVRSQSLDGPLEPDAFSIIAVDDIPNPFSSLGGSVPARVDVRLEAVPVGGGEGATRAYLFVRKGEGESLKPDLDRIRPWLSTYKLPEDHRLAWGPVFARDPAGRGQVLHGWRSYIVMGETIVNGKQIERVQAQPHTEHVSPFLLVTLTTDGATAFEKFTGDHIKRRAAVVVRGQIESAPVIQEAIAGGVVRLNSPLGDTAQMLDKLSRSKNP